MTHKRTAQAHLMSEQVLDVLKCLFDLGQLRLKLRAALKHVILHELELAALLFQRAKHIIRLLASHKGIDIRLWTRKEGEKKTSRSALVLSA